MEGVYQLSFEEFNLWYLIRICNYHSEDICKDEDIAENKSFASAPIRERNYSMRKNNKYLFHPKKPADFSGCSY